MNMEISKEIIDRFYNCLWSSERQKALNCFKIEHPREFSIIFGQYSKRCKLNKNVDALFKLSPDVYWFTLTFNENKDSNNETTKRKEAFNHLNNCFIAFVAVEEYGEDNERYHLHGFGVFRRNKDFKNFTSWHSRQNIKKLCIENEKAVKKKIKYLTNYACKCVPRIRRNKKMVELERGITKAKKLLPTFDCLYQERINKTVLNVLSEELPFQLYNVFATS